MAHRINISIPDELHESLQQFKDTINVSKICQEAITEIVQRKEDFRKRMNESQEMKEIIKRLQKEKTMSEGIVFERGKKDGEEWAKIAHYDDLVARVDELEETGDEWQDEYVMFDIDDYIVEYLCEKHGIDPGVGDIEHYLKEILPDLKVHVHNYLGLEFAYHRGWCRGIFNFWNEIKDKILMIERKSHVRKRGR